MLAENREKQAECKAFIVMDMMKMCVFATQGHVQPRLSTFDCGFFDFILH